MNSTAEKPPEPVQQSTATLSWNTRIADAPRTGRPVLLRAKWNGWQVAIVGVWRPEHGAFCTQGIFGEGQNLIFPDAWAAMPEFTDT